MKYITIALIGLVITTSSCSRYKSRHTGTAGYYSFQTECLGTEYDGSVTVRAWGKGRYRFDAVDQARKEAVRTILFKNMRSTNQPGCDLVIPLLNSENYLQTHAAFFNDFFKDDGPYANFVSRKDEALASKERKDAKKEATFGVVVRVKRSALRDYLIQNRIL
jgi:hypothetical protein